MGILEEKTNHYYKVSNTPLKWDLEYRYNSKNVKNTHERAILLVKLQAEVCNFSKSNTPPWVFFTFLNCPNGNKSRKASHAVIFTRRSPNISENYK